MIHPFAGKKVLYCHMSINQHKVLVPDNMVIVFLTCGIWNDFSGIYFCFLLVLNSCLVTFEVGKLVWHEQTLLVSFGHFLLLENFQFYFSFLKGENVQLGAILLLLVNFVILLLGNLWQVFPWRVMKSFWHRQRLKWNQKGMSGWQHYLQKGK